MKRLLYLDNLKLFLILLVIFHHAASPFSPWSSWPYTPSNPEEVMPWIWHFNSTNASFFMGLFFMVSGYFIPGSYDRQGFKTFCKKKLIRLLIPVAVFGSLLTAVTGKLELGHLWFVDNLLVFCLIYALIRLIAKPISKDCSSKPSLVGMLVLSVIMGAGGYFIRLVSPQDNWYWLLGCIRVEPAHILQYAMMFFLGVISFRFNYLEKISHRTGAVALLIGLALVVGNLLRAGLWNDFVTRWFGFYESFLCVFFSFGLLYMFRECLNRPNRFLDWCSEQSFGVYVFHLFILLGIQFAMDSVNIPAVVKLLLAGLLCAIVSFPFTALFRRIPGMKKIL